MKKNILLIGILFALSSINAQNIQNIGVSFTQTLYPKKTLPANIKNYAVTVTTPYLKDDSTFRKIVKTSTKRILIIIQMRSLKRRKSSTK